MKKSIALWIACLLAVMPALALADSALRVSGSATVKLPPDRAVLTVGFSTENADAKTAQDETARVSEAIIAAVKEAGIADEDIMTAHINIYPVYNYEGDGQSLRGYRVEHMLFVTVRDMDALGTIMDEALAAGANEMQGVSYQSSQEKEAYKKALALAVEDATEKAEALAIASGLWIDSLETVHEIDSGLGYRYAERAVYDMSAGASLGGSVVTGDIEVTASVELVYDVR